MKSLKRLAKKTAVSFGLVCVSAVVVATAAFLITKNFLPDAAGLTAMSIGLYIGGTPNLLAIGSAMLGTGHEAIVLANTADLFVGGLYFLFLLTAAKPVYSFVLDGKKRKKQKASDKNTTENKVSVETATGKLGRFKRRERAAGLKRGNFSRRQASAFRRQRIRLFRCRAQ